MTITFPANPGDQTPVNTFSPTSTPDENDANAAIYVWNGDQNQWRYAGPNVNPDPDSEIATPTITFPVNGADDVDPNANLTITSSAFNGTDAGEHESSSWQVIRGALPIRSTNAITAVTNVDADWAAYVIDDTLTQGRIQQMIRNPDDTDQILAIVAMTDTGPCRQYFTDDNGDTWTQGPQLFSGSSFIQVNTQDYGSNVPVQYFGYRWEGGVMLWGTNRSNTNNYEASWNTWDRIAAGDSWTTFTTSSATSRFVNPAGVWPKPGANQIVVRFAGSTSSAGWQNFILRDPAANPTAAPVSFTPALSPGGTNAIGNNPAFVAADVDNGISIYFAGEQGSNFLARRTDGFDGNLEDGNWTIVVQNTFVDGQNAFENVFGASPVGHTLFFDDNLNLFVFGCSNGLFTSPDGLNWTAVQTPMVVQQPGFFTERDGLYCISSTNLNQMMFTRTFTDGSFSPVFSEDNTDPFAAATFIGVDGEYGAQFPALRADDEPHDNQCLMANIPADETTLTIAGCEDDGFTVGRRVQQFNSGEEAEGDILAVDNTSMTIFPTEGEWEVGGRVMTAAVDFNLIVDLQENTDNLTTLTIDADDLVPNAEYSARVQYRSNTNVTSLQSDWSAFETDNG